MTAPGMNPLRINPLRIGYVPLTDAAVLIAAVELGFTAARGVPVILEREPSWATLRDKLVLGHLDAAHMLAPLAVATSLGLTPGASLPLVASFTLNLNGNAVTLSTALWRELTDRGATGTPEALAARLAEAVRARAARGAAPLTLATVFPFSTHTFQLRRLMALGGIDPDRDVRITVVPPPYMVEALRDGAADGFCVGSPWNSVAVEAGIGRIAVLGTDIMPDAPEKVLAWPRGRVASDLGKPLVAALGEAAIWCADPRHHGELAVLLGAPRHLALDPDLIRRTLDGRLLMGPDGASRSDPAYLRLGGFLHRPDPAHGRWIHAQMAEAGQVRPDALGENQAADLYDPTLYDAAVGSVPQHG